jgi:hypothetical protein
MSKNIRQVTEKHRAFYEVVPYYVLLEEGHGTPAVKTRKIQAGFDVNVYGLKTSDDPVLPGLSPGYALACASLLELTKTIQSHTTDACSIEVIPFGSTAVLDTKSHLQPQAMLRIRITHQRGLDQPADKPERYALEEVERELCRLGVASGRPATRFGPARS